MQRVYKDETFRRFLAQSSSRTCNIERKEKKKTNADENGPDRRRWIASIVFLSDPGCTAWAGFFRREKKRGALAIGF